MITRHALSVINVAVRMGFKRSFANKEFILGSFITYTLLMVIYTYAIRMFPEARVADFGFTHQQMIWYLATAELFAFLGSGWSYKELQNDVASGHLLPSLVRPSSFMLVRGGIWFGESLVRIFFLFPFYIALMSFLADGFIMRWGDVVTVILAMPLAIFMMNCAAYAVGLSCLWIMQSEPAYWLWEKSMFLLGAMLWPLAFYPDWLQILCWLTPFPSLLAIGGKAALMPDWQTNLLAAGHQILWAGIFLFFMRWLDRKTLSRIQSGEV